MEEARRGRGRKEKGGKEGREGRKEGEGRKGKGWRKEQGCSRVKDAVALPVPRAVYSTTIC